MQFSLFLIINIYYVGTLYNYLFIYSSFIYFLFFFVAINPFSHGLLQVIREIEIVFHLYYTNFIFIFIKIYNNFKLREKLYLYYFYSRKFPPNCFLFFVFRFSLIIILVFFLLICKIKLIDNVRKLWSF